MFIVGVPYFCVKFDNLISMQYMVVDLNVFVLAYDM
ncbi:hypothetical protein IMAU20120_02618 [Lactiplantibacillus plantarum]|nr:hypothetical protein [Lactiplantibacillus plantarum]MCG0813729.1 hypothetical protein [Lactiplantibacillus plantarum]MCG0879074.1 hypothetical protein [Lactiplantibacillus plantarum]MCG0951568.1 hypothetical protein [Lactiplantibacillus plantarum]